MFLQLKFVISYSPKTRKCLNRQFLLNLKGANLFQISLGSFHYFSTQPQMDNLLERAHCTIMLNLNLLSIYFYFWNNENNRFFKWIINKWSSLINWNKKLQLKFFQSLNDENLTISKLGQFSDDLNMHLTCFRLWKQNVLDSYFTEPEFFCMLNVLKVSL